MKYRAGNAATVMLVDMKVAIPFVLSTDYRSLAGNFIFAVMLAIPLATLIFVFTYLKMENHTLEYVNFLIQRQRVDIKEISKIERGKNILLFPRTYVHYKENNLEKRMDIYHSFSDKTMQRFLRDIRKINPGITVKA
jgi:uncharacterized membrane protein YoaT (DUF817 family)